LALSIAGLTSQNGEIVRGAYVSMNLVGEYVIVPLSFAALLTGLVHSLGTRWGLFPLASVASTTGVPSNRVNDSANLAIEIRCATIFPRLLFHPCLPSVSSG
jgi:hypothetical protein